MASAADLAAAVRGADCYYARLGLQRGSDAAQIRKAYLVRAKYLHPDKNRSADATLVFQRLSEAFDHLSDPTKRAVYDTTQSRVSRAPPPPPPSQPFNLAAWVSDARLLGADLTRTCRRRVSQ